MPDNSVCFKSADEMSLCLGRQEATEVTIIDDDSKFLCTAVCSRGILYIYICNRFAQIQHGHYYRAQTIPVH